MRKISLYLFCILACSVAHAQKYFSEPESKTIRIMGGEGQGALSLDGTPVYLYLIRLHPDG